MSVKGDCRYFACGDGPFEGIAGVRTSQDRDERNYVRLRRRVLAAFSSSDEAVQIRQLLVDRITKPGRPAIGPDECAFSRD